MERISIGNASFKTMEMKMISRKISQTRRNHNQMVTHFDAYFYVDQYSYEFRQITREDKHKQFHSRVQSLLEFSKQHKHSCYHIDYLSQLHFLWHINHHDSVVDQSGSLNLQFDHIMVSLRSLR